ncbi:aminotransferase class I/II-fold pyridoxal phosphate-dependent enzyme [Bengtsoniella intestinalis]|uniref:aminotransferase class I/II-fold pyridoxal phosphate-dependent enzyme n=1 Tax=Bengtsoniella intestinalis TaxID=3073143 RepID=UPI00391F4977
MPNSTILQTLQQVSSIPFHMPGHKRNTALAPYLETLGAELDITEIDGSDCLHHADGIIAAAMDKAKTLWHTDHSYLLINGSTCGILSGIHATTTYGDTIIMVRGCHKAVYNGVKLCGLHPVYLTQPQQPEGYYDCVSLADIDAALTQYPHAKLVVVTSPTYEGYLADIPQITAICHRHGVPLLVDEAHGAHLGFSPYFTGSAVTAGADIIIQSLHKTLPSLTQTAIAHVQGTLVNPQQFANSLGVFESSSPSYLLMASIDCCLDLLQTQGDDLFTHWQSILEEFYHQTASLTKLKVVQAPSTVKDPSKLLISTAHINMDGTALADALRLQHNIELELAYGDYALAMTGMGNTAAHLQALASALQAIDGEGHYVAHKPTKFQLPTLPPQALPAHRLHNRPITPCALDCAAGQVCGSYIWAYPPGVPIIALGETITRGVLDLLQALHQSGVTLQDTAHLYPRQIATIANETE